MSIKLLFTQGVSNGEKPVNTPWLLWLRWVCNFGLLPEGTVLCLVWVLALQYNKTEGVEGEGLGKHSLNWSQLSNVAESVCSRAKTLNVGLNRSIAILVFQIHNKIYQLKVFQDARPLAKPCLLKCTRQVMWRWTQATGQPGDISILPAVEFNVPSSFYIVKTPVLYLIKPRRITS